MGMARVRSASAAAAAAAAAVTPVWATMGLAGAAVLGLAGCATLPAAAPVEHASAALLGQAQHDPATDPDRPNGAVDSPMTADAALAGVSANNASPTVLPAQSGFVRPAYAQIATVDAPPQDPTEAMYPRFALTGEYLYGSANGFTQIPKGGKVGTASGNRPRFSEIGFDTVRIEDVELSARLDPNQEVFGGAQFINPSGGGVLQKALVTQGTFVPAKHSVAASEQLNWYRFGYRYQFALHTADNEVADVTFTPWGEGFYWDFAYSFYGGRRRTASRAFSHVGVQIGGEIAWRPDGGPLTLAAGAGSFPPVSNIPQISVEYAVARYHFYSWRHVDFTGTLGVALEQQSFQDTQKLPNHIDANFEPLLIAGATLTF